MKAIKLVNAVSAKNSENCSTLEYSFGDSDIDLGTATIKGRFPENGYAYNEISKELIFVLDGSGKINFEKETIEFSKGDAILIEPEDRYFFESEYCFISMTCSPAWSPLQHKIEE